MHAGILYMNIHTNILGNDATHEHQRIHNIKFIIS